MEKGTMTLSGPMFEGARQDGMYSVSNKKGAHYNIFAIDCKADGKIDPSLGMGILRQFYPDGLANDNSFVLFSTSGVHGTYTTIEEIEDSIKKHGDVNYDAVLDGLPDDYVYPELTVLIVEPRIVCMRYGHIRVRAEDIDFLKTLRASSLAAVATIGV